MTSLTKTHKPVKANAQLRLFVQKLDDVINWLFWSICWKLKFCYIRLVKVFSFLNISIIHKPTSISKWRRGFLRKKTALWGWKLPAGRTFEALFHKIFERSICAFKWAIKKGEIGQMAVFINEVLDLSFKDFWCRIIAVKT